jgi:TRAP-type transport system small permease protein
MTPPDPNKPNPVQPDRPDLAPTDPDTTRAAASNSLPSRPPAVAGRGPLFYVGACALLGAMAVDAAAVAGRHLGIPLLGSLEIVQALILIASSSALVSATLANKHAAVHLLINRVPPSAKRWLKRLNAMLSVVFLVMLAVGTAWIASDLWNGHEQSELLHIPYAPLRIVCLAALLLAAAVLIPKIVRQRES